MLSSAEADERSLDAWPELALSWCEPTLPRHEIPDDVDTDDLVFGAYSDFVVDAWRRDEISKAKLVELLSL